MEQSGKTGGCRDAGPGATGSNIPNADVTSNGRERSWPRKGPPAGAQFHPVTGEPYTFLFEAAPLLSPVPASVRKRKLTPRVDDAVPRDIRPRGKTVKGIPHKARLAGPAAEGSDTAIGRHPSRRNPADHPPDALVATRMGFQGGPGVRSSMRRRTSQVRHRRPSPHLHAGCSPSRPS